MQTEILRPASAAIGNAFGTKLALDSDTLIVSSSSTSTGPKRVFVYERSETSLLKVTQLSGPFCPPDSFAFDLDIEGDTIVVGCSWQCTWCRLYL
ncbi:MAG: hypothetical protein ACI841_003599 [Planctomycetota bacterium]|jgi:hypothetical protein